LLGQNRMIHWRITKIFGQPDELYILGGCDSVAGIPFLLSSVIPMYR